MRLDLALLAEAATAKHGQLNILGTFDRWRAASYPARIPHFAIVLRVVARPAEVGRHRVTVTLYDSDRRVVCQADGSPFRLSFDMDVAANPHGAWLDIPFQTVMNLSGFTIPKPDAYSFAVMVNDELMGDIRLFAVSEVEA